MPSDVYSPFRSGDRPLQDVQRHVDVGLGFLPAAGSSSGCSDSLADSASSLRNSRYCGSSLR
jgi:hypothetical protein